MASSISFNNGNLGTSAIQQAATAPGAGGLAVEKKAINQMEIQGANDQALINSAGVGQNVNTVA